MNEEFTKWESDGRFMLASRSVAIRDWDDSSIGSGSADMLTCFQSAEAREYYIRSIEAERNAKHAQNRYESLAHSLRGCITRTGRIRRKMLLGLIGKLGAA